MVYLSFFIVILNDRLSSVNTSRNLNSLNS